jgi:hypothetical protein
MATRNPAGRATAKALAKVSKAPVTPKTAAKAAKPAPKAVRQTSKSESEAPKPAKRGGTSRAADKNAPTCSDFPPKRAKKQVTPDAVVINGREPSGAGVGEPPAGAYVYPDGDEDEYGLRKTTTPGVYMNTAGVLVDANGVMLDFKTVQERDQERFERVIGEKVDTPAKLLKAVSLDPTMPLAVRIDAAKSAAPYTDRKKPIGIDGGEDGKPVALMSMRDLRGLSSEELLVMRQLVLKAASADATDVQVLEHKA